MALKLALLGVLLLPVSTKQLPEVGPAQAAVESFEAWRQRLPTPPIQFTLSYSLGGPGLGLEPGPLERPSADLIAEAQAKLDAGEETLENWSMLSVGYARQRDPRLEEAWPRLGALLTERMEADPADLGAMLAASSMLEEYALFGGGPKVFGMALEHLERVRAIDPDSAEAARRLARLYIYSGQTWHEDPETLLRGMQWARAALLADPNDLEPLLYLITGFTNRIHLLLDETYGGHETGASVPRGSVRQTADWALELAREVPSWSEGLRDPALVQGALYAGLIPWSQAGSWGMRQRMQGEPVPEDVDAVRAERMSAVESELLGLRGKLDDWPAVRAGVEAALWALRTNRGGELADTEAFDAVLGDLELPGPWVELRFHAWVDWGKYVEAEQLLADLGAYLPEGRVALLRGKLAFARGEYGAAREQYAMAAEVEEQGAEAGVGVAFCDLALGTPDTGARGVLVEATQGSAVQEGRHRIWFALAIARALDGDLEPALESARAAAAEQVDSEAYRELVRELEERLGVGSDAATGQ